MLTPKKIFKPTKYFLHKTPYTPPLFQKKKLCSPSQNLLETLFKQSVFTQDTLHTSFISNRNLRFLTQNLLVKATFYHIFISFDIG